MKNLLLNENRRILKDLHDTFGIDFQENYTIKAVQLPKTLNAIIKENSDIINNDTVNLLLIENWRIEQRKKYRVIKFDKFGNYEIDLRTYYYQSINKYYRKSDFEKDRKDKKLKAFLVVANKKGHTQHELRQIEEELYYNNSNIRAKVDFDEIIEAYNNYFTWESRKPQLRGFRDVCFNKITFDFDISNMGFLPSYDYKVEDIIDKSGYNVYKHRQELERKARVLKTKRNKNELLNGNFEKDKIEVKEAVENVHKIIIKRISNTTAFDENLNKIYSNLFFDYSSIIRASKRFISDIENNITSFRSVESLLKDKNNILEDIEKLKNLF